MRILHMADIHLGKKVNGYSMEEEQQNVISQVLSYIQTRKETEQKIDAILLAGDIYDKSVPPESAVILFDEFVTNLAELDVEVYVISGNHDSAERLSYGSRLLEKSHVHVVGKYDGQIVCHTLLDAYGEVRFYLLPFVRPVDVRLALDCDVKTYQEAMEEIMRREQLDETKRNILVAHQNINGACRSDSEDVYIGGLDGIGVQLFEGYDYVALGHLHQNQKVGSDVIRYAGSPVKYSVSEWNHIKGMNEIVLKEKGNLMISKIPFAPLHDMRVVTGKLQEILAGEVDAGKDCNDYVSVILQDETETVNAVRKLRDRYPRLMGMKYDNARTQNTHSVNEIEVSEEKSPLAYIDEFFRMTLNKEMSQDQRELVEKLVHTLWEEEE